MAQYNGVDVDNPDIVRVIRSAARLGMDKNAIITRANIGMPYEVIDRHYQEERRAMAKKKKKKQKPGY